MVLNQMGMKRIWRPKRKKCFSLRTENVSDSVQKGESEQQGHVSSVGEGTSVLGTVSNDS